MKKIYEFDYDFSKASAEFEVDLELFTPEMANATLTFYTWDYDKEADPIEEVMKKYAIEAIESATFNNYNARGVISDFENKEGFCRLNGETGIKLLYVEGFEFNDDDLSVKIKEAK